MKIKSSVALVLFAVFHFCFAERRTSETCLTPLRQEGLCKSILDCQFLKSLAIKENISRKEIYYLRRSACGFKNSTPLVCCPEYGAGTCKPSAIPPDPWSGCCGRTATTYFKRGTYIPAIDQYPWMALIEYDKGNKTDLLCSGALISSRYVVSDAVCIKHGGINLKNPNKRVRLGEFDKSNQGPDCVVTADGGRDCTEGAVTVAIKDIILHPEYNFRRKINCIALIMLSEAVQYTDFIRPICLPTMDLNESPPSYFKLYIAGWGATSNSTSSDLLRHVGLPYVELKTCQKAYKPPIRHVVLTNGHVCAGGQPGRDSCKGDSGAPLMYDSGPFVEVIGLVSFGASPCGKAKVPSVFTKVYAYDKWIRENIDLSLLDRQKRKLP